VCGWWFPVPEMALEMARTLKETLTTQLEVRVTHGYATGVSIDVSTEGSAMRSTLVHHAQTQVIFWNERRQ
jgi:hypothetical protein